MSDLQKIIDGLKAEFEQKVEEHNALAVQIDEAQKELLVRRGHCAQLEQTINTLVAQLPENTAVEEPVEILEDHVE